MNMSLERYQRQLALPEIGIAQQKTLGSTHIAFVGAGGLGAPALPYLAAAGIGKITIIDYDTISISNLHRQTVYKTADAGRSKSEAMAEYLRTLNPEIEVKSLNMKFCHPEQSEGSHSKAGDPSVAALLQDDIHLLIDGSDNFETKSFLNDISIKHQIPLISASVNQWAGQAAIYTGHRADAPCYHCLFPELPSDARNCNEAGILGTSAGLAGLYEAHLALLYLLGMEQPGTVLTIDFCALRLQKLNLEKNPDCPACQNGKAAASPPQPTESKMPKMLVMKELAARKHVIVDVRAGWEIEKDPIPCPPENLIHMELTAIPARHEELPKDKLLAFVCAGNIRSAQAAQYLETLGYANVCVLDKFSI